MSSQLIRGCESGRFTIEQRMISHISALPAAAMSIRSDILIYFKLPLSYFAQIQPRILYNYKDEDVCIGRASQVVPRDRIMICHEAAQGIKAPRDLNAFLLMNY